MVQNCLKNYAYRLQINFVLGMFDHWRKILVMFMFCQRHCPADPGGSVDRKLDLLVGELVYHRVAVVGIQETKWFGSDVWHATGGYTLLHSGRSIPNDDVDGIARREGVGILMNRKATGARRAADEKW